jgi:hypothetical protein
VLIDLEGWATRIASFQAVVEEWVLRRCRMVVPRLHQQVEGVATDIFPHDGGGRVNILNCIFGSDDTDSEMNLGFWGRRRLFCLADTKGRCSNAEDARH